MKHGTRRATIASEEAEPPDRRVLSKERVLSQEEERQVSLPFPADVPVEEQITLKSLSAEKPSRTFDTIKPSTRSKNFLKLFHPEVSVQEWNDWQWQLRNRVCTLEALARVLNLSESERLALTRHRKSLPFRITPYFLSLLDRSDAEQALRRTMVPVIHEFEYTPGEAEDPLGEDTHTPVPGLVHRYPDRVLFLVSAVCSAYCRYCTRSRVIANPGEYKMSRQEQWEGALAYIAANTQVRDVLISGGDPLALPDAELDYLLSRIKKIPHVEFVRIGTKAPVVMPQRITRSFARMLKKHGPLWVSIHFTHPDELTPEVGEACARLADAGMPLGSQTVLLRGINDSVETMRRLVHGLLKMRVRPYYLYQCDPIVGSSHFRTPVSKGLEIIQGLRGFTTGYAVPHYVIDAPGGGGKIPLLPEYVEGREGSDLLLRNFEGKSFRYPDTIGNK